MQNANSNLLGQNKLILAFYNLGLNSTSIKTLIWTTAIKTRVYLLWILLQSNVTILDTEKFFTSSFRFSIILSRIAFYATNFWLTIPKAIVKYVRRRQTFVTRFTKWWSQPLVTFTMWEAASPNPQITLIIVNAVMIIINQKNRQHSEYKLSAWKSESTTKVQTHMSRCVT